MDSLFQKDLELKSKWLRSSHSSYKINRLCDFSIFLLDVPDYREWDTNSIPILH